MDALAIVDSLLGDDPKGIAQESYDDFHASAKVKSANPEVRLMPSRRFEYGQDVLLMTDGGPLYAGTIVPRGKLWKIAAVAKNLGRRTLGSIDFYTETPEEAAQGLLDALKPWWENKLRWHSAHADVMAESYDDFNPKETALEMTALPEGYTLRPNPKWNAKDRIEEQPVFDVVDPGGSVIGTLFHYSGRGPEDEGLHWAAMRRKPDGLLDMERGTDYFKHQPEAVAHLIRLVPNKVSARVAEALCDEIDAAAKDAAKPNSPEQAEAGNYQKGHCSLHGLQIAIENAKGSTRSGTCDDGSTWSVTMPAHYGYIKGTQGKDKDHIDVYIGPKPGGFLIFVVNQNTKGGKFDEHKCMFGFESKDEAIKCYDKAFSGDLGPKLRASVVSTTVDKFKAWLEDGNHKKPFENLSESLVESLLGDDDDDDLKRHALSVTSLKTFAEENGYTDISVLSHAHSYYKDVPFAGRTVTLALNQLIHNPDQEDLNDVDRKKREAVNGMVNLSVWEDFHRSTGTRGWFGSALYKMHVIDKVIPEIERRMAATPQLPLFGGEHDAAFKKIIAEVGQQADTGPKRPF